MLGASSADPWPETCNMDDLSRKPWTLSPNGSLTSTPSRYQGLIILIHPQTWKPQAYVSPVEELTKMRVEMLGTSGRILGLQVGRP